ncbi:MAG TPA: hypothetical protein VGJ13_07560 [Pseudonocardiaceae bacterium]|jgi:ABC-type enterobactin transport system permease subunit
MSRPAPTSGRNPLAAADRITTRRRQPGGRQLGPRVLRLLSGVLAGGLVMLALAVGLAKWFLESSGHSGPGTPDVIGHAVAALSAVVLQLVVDRSRGPRAALAAALILVLVAGVLWFGWWS